jgi:uncharacterized protein with ATP-grasp and redox domains
MKIQKECVPCLFKRILFEIDQSTDDIKIKDAAIQKAAKAFSEIYSHDGCSADIATKVHEAAYIALHDNDPYKNLKKESNKIAQLLLPKAEEYIQNAEDSLKMSMIISIIGNTLDFGIDGGSKHPSMLQDMFDDAVVEGLGFDDSDKLISKLSKCKKIVLFTDNCGEVVFDKVLCQQIKKRFPNLRLTVIVKGEPVLSDATMEDFELLDFWDVVDDVLTTGCFAVGVDFDNLPDDLSNSLDESDLIICKGMANYEVFSETSYKPIVYLLRTKCDPIARSMDLPVNISAIKMYE